MQQYVTPHPGRTGPNLVNTDLYKMHCIKHEYSPDEFEILIERWIPETGWSRTQLMLSKAQLDKFQSILAK